MSSGFWFPFYPGVYLNDTMGLSACEHGCYLLLLMHSWSRGPLRDDLDYLRRISGDPPAETVRFILTEYWLKTASGWINARLEAERIDVEKRRERRVEAGRKGGKQRASNAQAMLEQGSSPAQHNTIQNNTIQNSTIQNSTDPTLTGREEAPNGAMSGKPDREAAKRVLDHLNAKTGSAYKFRNNDGKVSKNAELVMARIREHGEQALVAVVDLKVQQWTSDKMRPFLRPATLFGKEKCEQYVGEAAGDQRDVFDRWVDETDSTDAIEGDYSRE